MKRGDIVTAAPPGDFGKPRPALIIQAFSQLAPERLTLALITSDLLRLPNLRIPVLPSILNGLTKPSEIAVDNIQTFPVRKVGTVIGTLDESSMIQVEEALRRHLGLT